MGKRQLCNAKLEHCCFKTKQSMHCCHFQSWCFPTHKLILFTCRKKANHFKPPNNAAPFSTASPPERFIHYKGLSSTMRTGGSWIVNISSFAFSHGHFSAFSWAQLGSVSPCLVSPRAWNYLTLSDVSSADPFLFFFLRYSLPSLICFCLWDVYIHSCLLKFLEYLPSWSPLYSFKLQHLLINLS